jgi:hypothetical protein
MSAMRSQSNADLAMSLSMLERFMEQLAAPDLTVAEANALRPRLLDLLNELAGENAIAGTINEASNSAGELTIAGCAERCAVA